MIVDSKLPIQTACNTLNMSRACFYRWKNQKEMFDYNSDLKKQIQEIALEFPKYGYRRITKELYRRNEPVNHKKVLRIMRENNLLVKRKKFKPITTQSNHGLPLYPNKVKDLAVTRLNQVWVSDITYIHLPNEFVYLAAIIDIFSRKCIGWNLGRNIDAKLAVGALNMAIRDRKDFGFHELIHHSDRGVQYASLDYVNRLKSESIQISMTESGNPRENAFAETFMKTLKVEEVYINEYKNFEDAYKNIKQFIEVVYNNKRLHSSIGYKPPIEFESEVLNIEVN